MAPNQVPNLPYTDLDWFDRGLRFYLLVRSSSIARTMPHITQNCHSLYFHDFDCVALKSAPLTLSAFASERSDAAWGRSNAFLVDLCLIRFVLTWLNQVIHFRKWVPLKAVSIFFGDC